MKTLKKITYIGSRFPDPEINFGDSDIDYEIKIINGEQGDPDLVWKLNEFQNQGNGIWLKENLTEGWTVKYDTGTEILELQNTRDQMYFKGKVSGIETLRNLVENCKINLSIWT